MSPIRISHFLGLHVLLSRQIREIKMLSALLVGEYLFGIYIEHCTYLLKFFQFYILLMFFCFSTYNKLGHSKHILHIYIWNNYI